MRMLFIALVLVCASFIGNQEVVHAQERGGGTFSAAGIIHDNSECEVYQRDITLGLSGSGKVRLCKRCFDLGEEEIDTKSIQSRSIDDSDDAEQDSIKRLIANLGEKLKEVATRYSEEVERNKVYTTVNARQFADNPDFKAITESLRRVKRACVEYNHGCDSFFVRLEAVLKSSKVSGLGQVYKTLLGPGSKNATLFDSLTQAELEVYSLAEKLVDILASSKGKWKIVDGEFSFSNKTLSKKVEDITKAIELSKKRVEHFTQAMNSTDEEQLTASLKHLKPEGTIDEKTDKQLDEGIIDIVKLLSLVERFKKEMQRINAEYDSVFSSANLDYVMEPSRLALDSTSKETQKLLRVIRQAVNDKRQNMHNLFEGLDDSVKKSTLSNDRKKEWAEIYSSIFATFRPLLDSLCVLDLQYVDILEQIAKVYYEERGNWELTEEGKAAFDGVTLRRVKALTHQLNALIERRNTLIDEINALSTRSQKKNRRE